METTRSMNEALLSLVQSLKSNAYSDTSFADCNTPQEKKVLGGFAGLIMDMILAQKRTLTGVYEKNGTIPFKELIYATNKNETHKYPDDFLEILQVYYENVNGQTTVEQAYTHKSFDIELKQIQISSDLWNKIYEVLDNLALENLSSLTSLKLLGCIYSNDLEHLKIPNYIEKVELSQQTLALNELNQERTKYDYCDLIKMGFVDCSEELTDEERGIYDNKVIAEIMVKKMYHPKLREHNPYDIPSEFLLLRRELPLEISKTIPVLGAETDDTWVYKGFEDTTNQCIEAVNLYNSTFTFEKPKGDNSEFWIIEITDEIRFSDYYLQKK